MTTGRVDETTTTTTTSRTTEENDDDNTMNNNNNSNDGGNVLQGILLASATGSMILIGVGLILIVAGLPWIIYQCFVSHWLWAKNGDTNTSDASSQTTTNTATTTKQQITIIWIIVGIIQFLHIRGLWKSTRYLALMRFLVLPIRKGLMPIVFLVIKIESIRETTSTLYLDVRLPSSLSSSEQREGENNNNSNNIQTNTTRDQNNMTTPLLSEPQESSSPSSTIPPQQSQDHDRQRRCADDSSLAAIARRRRKKKKQVQRRYKQMERAFHRDHIRHDWGWSETTLNLSQVVPVMWEHEKRICYGTTTTTTTPTTTNSLDNPLSANDKQANPVEEFLKRFLIVSVVPDAILDFYYCPKPVTSAAAATSTTNHSSSSNNNNDNEEEEEAEQEEVLCALQLSLQQGHVFHWLMYFSRSDVTMSGIWFHGIGTAIERSQRIDTVDFCNGQVHKAQSKQHAGLLDVAEWSEQDKLSQLYPWSFTTTPSRDAVHVDLWPRPPSPPPSANIVSTTTTAATTTQPVPQQRQSPSTTTASSTLEEQ